MNYQWDPKKAASNLQKHGIDLADAVGVFEDEWALTIKEQYVAGEQRLVTMGMDFLGRVLVVVYRYRNDDIRLISARSATKREKRAYERKRV
ncbi:MAG: BrnT family toxin [Promethearchaeota archaeon]